MKLTCCAAPRGPLEESSPRAEKPFTLAFHLWPQKSIFVPQNFTKQDV
jgi:hypothetical protein